MAKSCDTIQNKVHSKTAGSVSQSTMQFWLKTNNMQVHKLIPIQTCGQRRRQKISPHRYGDDKIGRLVAVTTCAQLKYRQQVCSR